MRKRFKYFSSLRLKLIGSAILIELVMLTILIWNGMRIMESNLTAQMQHRLEELQPLLNASLAGHLLQQDLVTLHEIVQQFVKTEIRYLAIYNVDNEQMVQSGTPLHTREASIKATQHEATLQHMDEITLLQMPIQLAGRQVGHLVLEFDTRFIQQAITVVRTQSGLIAGIEITLSILLLGLVGYTLMKHLQTLTRAAQSMAEGDLTVRIPVRNHDEVGLASETFNLMADRIASDQAHLRKREIKISQLNTQLEQRVEQRTAELQQANQQLEQSLQELQLTQDQLVQSEKMASLGGLVAGVAHEINTPVGVGVTAVTHLQMKLEQYADRYQASQLTREDFESLLATSSESSKIIYRNLNHAAELIRSFKQVAVDQTSDERRRINLQEYLQEILQSLKPNLKAGDHQVSINCPRHLVLYSHPGALSQVITNLVMNSLIHGFAGRPKGHIEIKVSEDSVGDIRLAYRDDGNGIAAGNVEKIFEPFFTTRRDRGGTGLGLHIVFNLVTQTLGGRIECQSVKGEGTRFHIKLSDLAERSLSGPSTRA